MIYFVKSPEGPIKIGTTDVLSVRLKQLGKEYGSGLRVLGVTIGSIPEEKVLHRSFSHLRIIGEWFRPDVDLLRFIELNCEPWDESRDYGGLKVVTVKVSPAIASKAKAVAQHLGISVAELISDVARSPIDRMYAKMLRELEAEEDRR